MIVLGQSIVGIVQGGSLHGWDVHTAVGAGFGLAIAYCFWWNYFQIGGLNALHPDHKDWLRLYLIWIFAHLPLTIGITGAAVGMEGVFLAHPGAGARPFERWVLCGMVALCILSMGLIRATVIRANNLPISVPVVIWRIAMACGLAALAYFGEALAPAALMGIVAAGCALYVMVAKRGMEWSIAHPKAT